MTCREFTDFLMDYLSNELAEDVRQRFDHHLTVCENCRRYLDSYRESAALGRLAFKDADSAVPADIPEGLVHAILESRRRT
jgi:anti-sigma factor RsiW